MVALPSSVDLNKLYWKFFFILTCKTLYYVELSEYYVGLSDDHFDLPGVIFFYQEIDFRCRQWIFPFILNR